MPRDELEAMVEQGGFVTIAYTQSKELLPNCRQRCQMGTRALYYVFGPGGMVSAVKRP